MTAAAHHPRYIGAKVDLVDRLPEGFDPRCVPVAEVLILRVRPGEIDPLVLLLWLRSDEGRTAIQSCVTGQTAHLSARDVTEVVVPDEVAALECADAVESLRESLTAPPHFRSGGQRGYGGFQNAWDLGVGGPRGSEGPKARTLGVVSETVMKCRQSCH